MEKKEEVSAYKKNGNGMNIIPSLAKGLQEVVMREISPPSKEIQEMAKVSLQDSLSLLKQENCTDEEILHCFHALEKEYEKREGMGLSRETLLKNVHFWLRALRDKGLRKGTGTFGLRLKFIDFDIIDRDPIPNDEVGWLVEQRVEQLKQIEENFKAWIEEYKIEDLLKEGSVTIITNHDQLTTQPISLYLFQKFLGVSPYKSATTVGGRVLTFQKFGFDPERFLRGQGHVLLTNPPGKNGRNDAFDRQDLKEKGIEYKRCVKNFLSETASVLTFSPPGTHDLYEKRDGKCFVNPVSPSKGALKFLEELQQITTILPMGFNHGERFHLENMDEEINLEIQFGAPIKKGGALSGEEIWGKQLDVVPNYDPSIQKKSSQHPESVSE